METGMTRRLALPAAIILAAAALIGGAVCLVVLRDGNHEEVAPMGGGGEEDHPRPPPDVQKGPVAGGEAEEPAGVLSGRVMSGDAGEERPVEGALVSLQLLGGEGPGYTAKTDAEGRFELRKLPAGLYTVTAVHDELVPAHEPFQLAIGSTGTEHGIRLKPGIDVAGTVVTSETNEPIADVEVAFRPIQEPFTGGVYPDGRRRGRTSPDGRFTLKSLEEGMHHVVLEARGRLRMTIPGVEVTPGGESLQFSLERGHAVSGRVLDDAGRPVAGGKVRVDLRPLADVERLQLLETESTTGDDGRYVIDGLLPLDGYTLLADHPDRALAWVTDVKVGPDVESSGVDFRMTEGWSIQGHVLDDQSQAVRGATVTAAVMTCGIDTITPESRVLSGIEVKETRSDEQGKYEFRHLGGRCYELFALGEGFLPEREDVRDRGSGSPSARQVDLYLRKSATIRGRVVDGSGSPLGGARVEAGSSAQETDGSGTFTIGGLHGRVSVTASREGFQHAVASVHAPVDDVSLVLQRLATIAGRVRASARGGSTGVSVRALGDEELEWETDVLGVGGTFELSLPAGKYIVQAEASGFAPARSGEIAVGVGKRHDGIILELGPEAVVKGRVVLRGSGKPLPDAGISFRPARNLWISRATATDWDGSFQLAGLPPGEFQLHVTTGVNSGIPDVVCGPFHLDPGELEDLVLELGKGGGIRGVFREGGKPPGARFQELNASISRQGDELVRHGIGPDGRFACSGLSPGDHGVSVWGTRSDGSALRFEKTARVQEDQVCEVRFDESDRIPVEGRVTGGGRPCPGVAIAAIDPWRDPESGYPWWDMTLASASTDEEGRYRLALGGGTSYFLLLRERDERGQAQVEVALPESVASFRFDIPLSPGRLEGVVVEKGTAIPVPDALVEVLDSGKELGSYLGLVRARRGRCKTDPKGRFALSHLQPGTYSIRVIDPYSRNAWEHGITVDESGPADVRIGLDVGLCLDLRIIGRQGYPVTDADAIVRDQRGYFIAGRHFDHGVEGLPPVPPGRYEVTVIHPRNAPVRLEVEINGEEETRTVTLSAGGSLRATVSDSAGNPVRRAEVVVLGSDGRNVFDDRVPAHPLVVNPYPDSSTTEDGTLVLEHLGPGRYKVTATKGAARSDEAEVTIAEGEVATVRLVLSERG
jgi:carboxypeptidase family protein